VAIIAASSQVNISFVMAMQTMRFLAVLALGPAVSRFVARHIPASSGVLLPEDAKTQLLSQVKEDEGELD
jgi:hypothetical protein